MAELAIAQSRWKHHHPLIYRSVLVYVSSLLLLLVVAAIPEAIAAESSTADQHGHATVVASAEIGPDGTVETRAAAASIADDEDCFEEEEEDDEDEDSYDDEDEDEEEEQDASCKDEDERCSAWADAGECKKNADYMKLSCAESCGACADQVRISYGEPQIAEGQQAEETLELIRKTDEYMRNTVMVKDEYRSVRKDCKNRGGLCSFWAVIGECEANPAYMIIHCAPACQSCEKVNIENRCPLDENAADALAPGDLNKVFERVTNHDDPEIAKYTPEVLLQPPDGPWIVAFDNFLTPEECELLIKMGEVEGYERSTDVGKRQFDGSYDKHLSDSRTSENAWCREECYEHPLAQNVNKKIANLTGIPEKNSEHLQLLKYEEGQYYKSHHDYIPFHTKRQCGVRILTLFLYLNDVPAGGGTNFNRLNLTVMPKQGKALLWPSVLDKDPNMIDQQTYHQALPVEEGVKYGANAWLHQRDFKTPNDAGCV